MIALAGILMMAFIGLIMRLMLYASELILWLAFGPFITLFKLGLAAVSLLFWPVTAFLNLLCGRSADVKKG